MKSAMLVLLLLCPPRLLAAAANSNSVDEIPALRPPRGELAPTFWEQNGFWVALIGALALALVCIGVWWLARPKPAEIVPPSVQARRSLEPLRSQAEDGQVLSRISQILRHYFAAVFNLPAGELTTSEFCRAIQASEQAGPELSSRVSRFLEQCDERKFALSPPRPPLGAVDRAMELIEQAAARLAVAAQAATPVSAAGNAQPNGRVG
jgi:hypothetical protein